MNLFAAAFYFSGFVYGLFIDCRLFYIYFSFIAFYIVIHFMIPSGKLNSTRRKIMFATWEKAYEGNIFIRMEIDVTKC